MTNEQISPYEGDIKTVSLAEFYAEISGDRNFHKREAGPELYAALKEFMRMWNGGDALSESKAAKTRRMKLWRKAEVAIAKAEGR